MGQYFLVVNPTKRQYLDAGRFDENVKNDGALLGWHAIAVGFLIRNALSKANETHPLIGSWAGDPVLTCGDYAPAFPAGLEALPAARSYANLYQLAEAEFLDISDQAIIMLCSSEPYWYVNESAHAFVQAARESREFLTVLGDLTLHYGVELLHRVLFEILGETWFEQYQAACQRAHIKRYYGRLERDAIIRERLRAKEVVWQREHDE